MERCSRPCAEEKLIQYGTEIKDLAIEGCNKKSWISEQSFSKRVELKLRIWQSKGAVQ